LFDVDNTLLANAAEGKDNTTVLLITPHTPS
jgi:hypothetical protein